MMIRLCGLAALSAVLLCAPLAASAQEQSPEQGYGVSETVKQIMDREAGLAPPATYQIGIKGKRLYPDRSKLPQNPASPDVVSWPAPPPGELLPPTESPQTPGVSFTGATLSGTNPTFAFPPDVMGDVGPTQYIVAVNGRIVSFSKTTGAADGVLNASMNGFFTSVRNGSGTSDPRIRFDRLTQRWFVLIINVATVSNRILLAVSNTATIGAGTVWTFYFLQHDAIPPAGDAGLFIDYPTLGIDANALYVGGNIFDLAGGGFFVNTSAYVIRKSSVTSGGPIVATSFRGLLSGGQGQYTPQGVDNFDAGATEGYFIAVDASILGRLVLRRVTDPAGSPTLSGNVNITVSATSNPANVRHLGNTNGATGYLNCVDDRLYQAVIRNGRLWTAHHILVNNTGTTSSPTRNAVRWYELSGLAGTPVVQQSGTVFTASAANTVDERNYWFPSVMVSGQGHAALGFSAAGTNEYANAATVGRLKSDAPGTMGTPLLLTAASAAYNPASDPGDPGRGRRWGDYTYTSLDPDDDMTMWTAQMFTNSTNSYGVRVIQLLAPPPVTPTTLTPASVSAGQASVNVTVTGPSVAGSAFFDPGPGFAKHIGASVNGSVSVNSVTFVNETTVVVNLNTSLATPGPRNFTVTNPDGQSRTGISILTLTAAPATLGLTSPNGGDTLLSGTVVPVTWNSANLSGNVRVLLSRNGGVSFPETLFANTTNDGTQSWTVTGPPTTAARVRILSISVPSLSDTSDGDFTIGVRSMTITAPAPAQTVAVDSAVTVSWTSAFLAGTVSIDLSRDAGASWSSIAAGTADDGSEGWTVTGPVTATALLRIRNDADTTFGDTVALVIGQSFSFPLLAGWNTLALPVDAFDPRAAALFPTAASAAFAHTPAGYAARDTLVPGTGYWLKFSAPLTGLLAGIPRTTDTLEVLAGWNLIGGIALPVPVDSIVQSPGGIIASSFFLYTNPGYALADTLMPARAYWVKASAPGQLFLQPSGPVPARPFRSPLPPLRIERR